MIEDRGRREAIRTWRDFSTNSEVIDDMRRHALDMLLDHFENNVDGDLDALDDHDRAQYFNECADGLAQGLLRYIGFWIINDFPTVSEWTERRQ